MPLDEKGLEAAYVRSSEMFINWNANTMEHARNKVRAIIEAYEANRSDTAGWQGMDSAPKDGAPILVWWPIVSVDDDGNLTATEVGGTRLVTQWHQGSWLEPEVLAGLNSNYFDDDREYAELPKAWRPLPAPPLAAGET